MLSLQRLHSQKVEQWCQSVSRVQCRNVSAALAGRKATTTGVSRSTRPLPVGARTKASFPAGQSAMPTFSPSIGCSRLNLGRFRQPELVRARRTGRGGGRSRAGEPCRVTTPSEQYRSNETRGADQGSKHAVSQVSGRSDGSSSGPIIDAEERMGGGEFLRGDRQQNRDSLREERREPAQ